MDGISVKDLKIMLAQIQKLSINNSIKGSRIFISGATGFFGKWLMEYFLYLNKELNSDIKICALSRDPEKFLDLYKFFKNIKCITWVKGDIRTYKFPLQQFDYLIHAAADADAKLNAEDPLLMLDTIIEGTKRIMEFAKTQSEIKGILFTSSGAVYGRQPENITHIREKDCFYLDINSPVSAYAEGKRMAELYCSIYAKQYNLPIKIARCFAFVGPYLPLDKHFAIGNFIANVLSKQDIIIKGDGTPLRSYMYASDLITWLLTILVKGEVNTPYNVGSDRAISISDLALLINSLQSHPKKVKIYGHKNEQPLEQYVPDITKCRENLNLELTISLEESITRTILFHKQNSL